MIINEEKDGFFVMQIRGFRPGGGSGKEKTNARDPGIADVPDRGRFSDRSGDSGALYGRDLAGEENVKTFLEEKAAAVTYNPDYDCTVRNIMDYWGRLVLFVLVFALLAMVTLEFIDKDRR